jgi:hypothetical protein
MRKYYIIHVKWYYEKLGKRNKFTRIRIKKEEEKIERFTILIDIDPYSP